MEKDHKLQHEFDLLNYHINNSPLAFIEWDEHFRIKTWSAKAQQMFGYSEQSVKGLSPLSLGFLDTKTQKQIKKKMDELLHEKHSSNKLETYIRTEAGNFLFVEFYNSALLDDHGNLISAVSFALDITQRKRAERRVRKKEALLHQLFKNSPIGIVRLNKSNGVVDINKSFEQLFGYTLDEAKGQNINNLIVPDRIKAKADAISDNTYAGRSTQTEAVRVRKDGTEVPVLIAGVPVKIGADTIAIYGMYVDITERKMAEEKIRRSLKEKETLLAEIHHRVKNNLALISGLLELQIHNSAEAKIKDALRHSQSRIISMATVHEHLYQSDTLSELDCLAFINKLTRFVSDTHSYPGKKINLELQIDSFEINVTRAIPLGLIINELLVNAYKHAFSHVAEGTIWVNLTKSGSNVSVTVRDNGSGFPDGLEPHNSEGLGLKLVQTLMKQLKGTLDMSSRYGSSFEVKFKME